MTRSTLVGFAVALMCATAPVLAYASIDVEPAVPGVGLEVVITVQDDDRPMPGQTVRVVHRPGLAGEQEQAVGITDGRGRVRWTPSTAGITTIRAGDARQTVRVDGPPAFDVLLWSLLLGVAGAAGLVYGLRTSGWSRSSS